jgi:hypothetical protein
VLSVESGGPVRVWDVGRRRVLSAVPRRRGVDGVYALDGRGARAVTAGDGAGLIYAVGGSPGSAVLRDAPTPLVNAGFHPNGRYVGAADTRGGLRIWSTADQRLVADLPPTDREPFGFAFTDDDRHVYALDVTGAVYVWDWRAGRLVARFPTTGTRPTIGDLSPDGRQIAIGDGDGQVTVWNVSDGRRLAALPRHKLQVAGVDFTPDSRFLVTSALGERTQVWRADNYDEPLHALGDEDDQHYGVAFSADGQRIVTEDLGRNLQTWNVADGTPVPGVVPHVPDSGGISTGHAFLTDAAGEIIVASVPGESWAWNRTDPSAERVTIPAGGSVALSDDGRYLVTAEADGLQLWNVRTAERVETLSTTIDAKPGLAVTRDARWVATVEGGRLRLWRCRLCGSAEQLIAIGEAQTTRRLSPTERRKFVGS